MTTSQTPSIFESFNARALTPTQIAAGFVPQEHYHKLAQRRHSLLIGPRGSGKTTLLKMLQPEALEVWAHPDAASYRARIDYTGVFVATDVSWGKQRDALGNGKLNDEAHKLFSRALFTTHVLKALVATMEYRLSSPAEGVSPFRRVAIDGYEQIKLVGKLSVEWQITPEIPSILALRHALLGRLSQIRQLASKESLLDETGGTGRLARIGFLHIHFVDAISNAVTFFNDAAGEKDARWAFMFDELEIAPPWIYEAVISSIRSAPDTLLFKLAVSPVSSPVTLQNILNTAAGPSSLDDYDPIPLWYVEKEEAYKFCTELWDSMMRERDLPPKTPEEILGASYSETHKLDRAQLGSAYHPESRIAKSFKSLSDKDPSFARFLEARRIPPSDLQKVPKTTMDQVVRKIAPIVLFRDYFRKPNSIQQIPKLRSRKVTEIYAGAESLFAITEGNPRWFIGIVGSLLDGLKGKPGAQISNGDQVRRVEQTASRFMARLKAIPLSKPATPARFKVVSIDALLNKIGDYFERMAIIGPFVPEPSLVFRVFPETSRTHLELLDKAANAGAIVYLPDGPGASKDLLMSVSGKRFRISYLLAPIYHLPLRTGPEVSLTRILASTEKPGDFFNEKPNSN